ncbi:MAG: glycosyltransferase family 9 protein [Candidatus Latescibacterota bacterium]
MQINTDCRHFRGDVPCQPHKKKGLHCEGCDCYQQIESKILIIKLGAIGDVIRTTPLLRILRQKHPHAQITWVTHSPEVVPSAYVDHILSFELKHILWLEETTFDVLYSLDKDREAIALSNRVKARTKKGFRIADGMCAPYDGDSVHKYHMGLLDDLNKANTKSYPEEIFEICGFKFRGERYILDDFASLGLQWSIPQPRPLVALNTGCGARWQTRLWPEAYWTELAWKLRQKGLGVLILGGEQEHEKNTRIAQTSGASYLGHFPLKHFINLMDQCDMVVTAVTMAMHIAIGLEKKLILLNNIFNPHEFELYGSGEIIQPPDVDCLGCFVQECEKPCMERIQVDTVLETCECWVKR